MRIEAARAAGMKSIGVNQNCELSPADMVVRPLDLLEVARHQQLPAPFLFISSTQPRHRVDANAKKERFD